MPYYNNNQTIGTGTPPPVGRIIDYEPQQQRSPVLYAPASNRNYNEQPPQEMGGVRRGLWMYTNKLGLEFSLVLLLSLGYQVFMAVFLGTHGIVGLPFFQSFQADPNNSIAHVLATAGAVLVAAIIQAMLIAEMAQVVWLRHPDKLKVRLMCGSIWWWVMLFALIISFIVDFLLLFLSVTNTRSLAAAWSVVQVDQMSGLTNLLLAVLNLLSLLRCASVMRTSTREEIRHEVEEKLAAIAEEILLDAGESARQKASKVWKHLSVDPQRFLPLHHSVLDMISQQHPDLVPTQAQMGGTWAYDFSGNTFAAVPPDMYHALMQNRYRVANQLSMPFKDEGVQQLWKLPPRDMATVINYNLDTYGPPQFVDVTEPDSPPNYIGTKPLDTSVFFENQPSQPQTQQPTTNSNNQAQLLRQPTTTATAPQQLPAVTLPTAANTTSFINTLSVQERSLFSIYLINVVFPFEHHAAFPAQSNVSIFDVFDEIDLQWYYRFWKKNGSAIPNPSLNKPGSNN